MNRPRALSSSGESLYDLLGLQKGANHDEIKKAYRKLALRFHPDKNQGNEEATEKFKEINHAHKVLMDNTKRGIYDRYGSLGLYAADMVGDENVNTYLVLTSGWCKALVICCGIITGCYCCCCCFCCCFNFCCGKYKPAMPDEDGEYANLHVRTEEYSSTPEDEDKPPIVSQPGSGEEPKGGFEGGAAIPMPPPSGLSENTTLTSDAKPSYGADSSSLDRKEAALNES
ncbi:dnaJ homolog subfamily C member 5-like isoform X1 [Ruditapes philippinarum]|uniref:dnaJ homolog subfamily C member 5-like isoform X1 n=1 Tax=Ruditapes philippinarum TaxID=129788 RepID=UPI00295AF350|nr:dnaJ homolog subfamily C member 5-like isoform X1 [Ruditapes philippinarum]